MLAPRSTWMVVLATCLLAIFGAARGARAADAAATAKAVKLYQDLFGQDEAQASKSRVAGEKAAFARKLVEAATLAKDDPALAGLLRERAMEFALAEPAGHELALRLMGEQAEAEPARRVEWLAKAVDLWEKIVRAEAPATRPVKAEEWVAAYQRLIDAQIQAGTIDAAVKSLDKAKAVLKLHLKDQRQRLAELEARQDALVQDQQARVRHESALRVLATKPDDAGANTTLGLYLLAGDDGAKAADAGKHLAKSSDEALRKLGAALSATPSAPVELADAYRAASTSPALKDHKALARTFVGRAIAFYDQALRDMPEHPQAARIKLTAMRMREADKISAAGGPANTIPAAKQVRWTRLFNGRNLDGWVFDGGDEQNFRVEDGVVVAAGANYKTRSYILTQREYANFAFRLEFNPEAGAGGAVAIRAIPGEKLPFRHPNGSVNHYFDHPLLKLFNKGGDTEQNGTMHWILDGINKPPLRAADMKPLGSWNQLEIEVRGQTLKASINGKPLVDATLAEGAKFPDGTIPGLNRVKGRVGIQKHTGTIRYRNIEIAELP